MDVQEVRKIDAYLKRLFNNPRIRVVPRPKKDDSAEVYIGEEFIGVMFVDDEDDERSYNFQMAILAHRSRNSEFGSFADDARSYASSRDARRDPAGAVFAIKPLDSLLRPSASRSSQSRRKRTVTSASPMRRT